jgi:NADH:ubiquinone oxidoreductase subunit K
VVGVLGCFVVKKNLVVILMALELMFIGVSVNFVVHAMYLDDTMGQLMGLFILVVAAAESSIGLAMIVIYYRLRGIVNVSLINTSKGQCVIDSVHTVYKLFMSKSVRKIHGKAG